MYNAKQLGRAARDRTNKPRSCFGGYPIQHYIGSNPPSNAATRHIVSPTVYRTPIFVWRASYFVIVPNNDSMYRLKASIEGIVRHFK